VVGIAELPGGCSECVALGLIRGHGGEVFASFAAAADGQDYLQVRVLAFQGGAGTKTAFGAVNVDFVVGPIVTELWYVSIRSQH